MSTASDVTSFGMKEVDTFLVLHLYNRVRAEARAQCTLADLAQLIYRRFSPTQSTPKISREKSQWPHSHLNFIFYINVTTGSLLTTTQIWLGTPNNATLLRRWEILFHGNKPSFLLLRFPSVFLSTKQNLGLRICFRFRRSELRFRFTIRNVIANGIYFCQILEFTVLHCISFLFLNCMVSYDLVCWCCMVLNCLSSIRLNGFIYAASFSNQLHNFHIEDCNWAKNWTKFW